MTVIRDAVIRIRTETVKGRVDAPESGPAERAYKAESKAAAEARQSVERLGEATRLSGVKAVNAFREGGEGALRFARGIAFLSASGSEDLRKLVQTVAIAQGAFDVFAGGFKAITSLSAVLGGPVTAAVAGVTVALGAGALAWSRWKGSAEASAKAVEQAIKNSANQLAEFQARLERVQAIERRRSTGLVDVALTPELQFARQREAFFRERAIQQAAERDIAVAESEGVSRPGIQRRVLGDTRTIEQASQRQIELLKSIYDTQKSRNDAERSAINAAFAQTSAAALATGAGGIAGLGGQLTGGAFFQDFADKFAQFTDQMQRNLERLVNASADAARRADDLERYLSNAK